MKTVDGCDFPSGHFIHYKPVSYNINGTVLILLSVVAHLKWSSVCLIFDNETGKLKYCFLATLEQLLVVFFGIHELQKYIENL